MVIILVAEHALSLIGLFYVVRTTWRLARGRGFHSF